MTPPQADPFHQPLQLLLGDRTAKKLKEQLNLETTADLLNYFPRRWIERGELTPINALPLGEQVTLVARVLSKSKRQMRSRKGFIVEVTVCDESPESLGLPATLTMSYFNGWNADKQLTGGTVAMFHGKTATYRGQLTLNNPDFTILEDASQADETALAPIPVYPATAKLPTWTIRTCIDTVLDAINWSAVADPVPADFLTQLDTNLPTLSRAYQDIHRPATIEDAYRARKRFAAHEALILQGVLAKNRARNASTVPAHPFTPVDDGLLTSFDAQLPFELTAGQAEAGVEISAELDSCQPMSRLLQGEVGSGKTLVAVRAMLQIVDGGGQAVLVAPTEVLATQHYRSITENLGQLATAGQLTSYTGPATQVVLLTGSMSTGEKREALLKIASGEAGIIIGTHALFSDNVSFAELGLVIIDEQHRFGVDQREKLRASNPGVHMLVMTATPIPRSVAMTVFGDLDITVLQGLPSGRQPVTTHIARMAHGPRHIGRVWEIIAEQAHAGHQAFIVCPKIDPADPNTDNANPKAHAAAVEELYAQLQELPVFEQVRIEALHGRQDAQTQAETMGRFVAGETDVIVATTIIEVGVDVPNATVLAILDADQFGLSTLHQLRGRVGRGQAAATCFLVTQLPDGHPSLERLQVVADTQDGFEIAAADVEIRGEGDVLGASQHGYASRLKSLRVIKHATLIQQAADWIATTLEADPELTQYPELAKAITTWQSDNEDDSGYLQRN